MDNFFESNKFIIVPLTLWFGIQVFKVLYDLVTTKKFNFKRIMGAGGMPSSHSAVVVSLTTMIGRYEGIQVSEKLVEVLGHTPVQVFVGAVLGFIAGMIF